MVLGGLAWILVTMMAATPGLSNLILSSIIVRFLQVSHLKVL